jgi:hypothetical protein
MMTEGLVRVALGLHLLDVGRQVTARSTLAVQEDVSALVRQGVELAHVAAFE